jgi:hypothetical protein
MHPDQERLAVADLDETILELDLAAPGGFDLGAEQLDSGLEAVMDVIFMESSSVAGQLTPMVRCTGSRGT